MTTATINASSRSYRAPSIGTRVDEFVGALISIKPSIIAACFSEAMMASNTIGTDELSTVSPEQIRGARKAMGLDA